MILKSCERIVDPSLVSSQSGLFDEAVEREKFDKQRKDDSTRSLMNLYTLTIGEKDRGDNKDQRIRPTGNLAPSIREALSCKMRPRQSRKVEANEHQPDQSQRASIKDSPTSSLPHPPRWVPGVFQ